MHTIRSRANTCLSYITIQCRISLVRSKSSAPIAGLPTWFVSLLTPAMPLTPPPLHKRYHRCIGSVRYCQSPSKAPPEHPTACDYRRVIRTIFLREGFCLPTHLGVLLTNSDNNALTSDAVNLYI